MTKQSDFHDFSLQAREDNSECTNAMTCGPKQRIDSAHTDSLHHLALWQTFPFYNLTVDCFSTSVHVGKLKLLLGFILTACKLHIVCFGWGNHSILDHTICVMLLYYCRHLRWGFEKSTFRILFCRTFPACSLARFTVDEIVIDANMDLMSLMPPPCWRCWRDPADDAKDPRDGLEALVDVEKPMKSLMKTHKLVMKPPHT